MKTKVCVLYARKDPMTGCQKPKPNQLYKEPVIEIEERTLDDLKPGHVRVKMLSAGICGIDIHLTQTCPESGYMINSAPAYIPAEGRIIGHEGVGRVLEIGSNVDFIKEGAYCYLVGWLPRTPWRRI